jgi:hypothetical protein
MADDSPRTRRRTATPDAPPPEQDQQDLLFGDLSGIARDAVRSPADPRLEAHLAFLGLGEEPVAAMGEPAAASAPAMRPAEAPVPPPASELEQLQATVARLERTVAELEARLRQLTFVIGVIAIASVLALIITIAR